MDLLVTLKALADPCRLRLVAVLLSGEFTVQELTAIMGVGQSKVSWHLKILTEAGILSLKRQGTWSYYRAEGACPLFSQLRPLILPELGKLPERDRDVQSVAAVMDARRRKSQEFFDRHAAEWDELAKALLPTPDCHERLLSLVPSGRRVVEIGFGTGRFLAAIAARAASVIGVDHSPVMLAEARRRLDHEGLAAVDLRLGEMTHLPLQDGSIDCAVMNMVLHHAADPGAVLTEMRRVLVPGGLLLVADLARHERDAAREQLADQWLGFSVEELRNWANTAGFQQVSCEHLDGKEGQAGVLLFSAS